MESKKWEMRRKDRKMEDQEARRLAEEGMVGVLSMVGEEGEPYAVPLSYCLCGSRLYFHCAGEGRKLDCLDKNPRVCFVVVGENRAVYQGGFTARYESVILEGAAHRVEGEEEKKQVLLALCKKYFPENMGQAPKSIEHSINATVVVGVEIERITGKANKEEKGKIE